jgi:hypothetical protein
MKRDIAEKWIAALRSGEYEQTFGKLFDGTGYCCLGVLCKVLGYEFSSQANVDGSHHVVGTDKAHMLPNQVMFDAGMHTRLGSFSTMDDALGSLNDRGETFTKIADIIDANYTDL